jgi:hypothetical protein
MFMVIFIIPLFGISYKNEDFHDANKLAYGYIFSDIFWSCKDFINQDQIKDFGIKNMLVVIFYNYERYKTIDSVFYSVKTDGKIDSIYNFKIKESSMFNYEHDKDNNLIQVIRKNNSGINDNDYTFVYTQNNLDKSTRLKTVIEKKISGKTTKRFFIYDNNKLKIIKHESELNIYYEFQNSGRIIDISRSYDKFFGICESEKKLIRRQVFDSLGRLSKYIEFIYDEDVFPPLKPRVNCYNYDTSNRLISIVEYENYSDNSSENNLFVKKVRKLFYLNNMDLPVLVEIYDDNMKIVQTIIFEYEFYEK